LNKERPLPSGLIELNDHVLTPGKSPSATPRRTSALTVALKGGIVEECSTVSHQRE